MNDPRHDRFRSWLTGGAVAELPRDVALHASACDDCLRLAAGLDALTAVNAGAAGAPPTLARPMRSPFIGTAIARTAAGIAAVGFVAVATAIGVGSLIPRGGGGLAGKFRPDCPGCAGRCSLDRRSGHVLAVASD